MAKAGPITMIRKTLNLLCAGAAQGLVRALEQRFLEQKGATLQGRFGAVGAMKEALLAGEACDVMVVTAPMIAALAADGLLRGPTKADLGRVRTGVAVRARDPVPDITTAAELRTALLAADSIYFPDPVRSTAGIHFAAVLKKLGVLDALQPRFRTFPNGADSMRELAAAQTPRPLGCTQVTEINETRGLRLVGPLPAEFELVTVYAAAVSVKAADPALAEAFIALLAGRESQALRDHAGFES